MKKIILFTILVCIIACNNNSKNPYNQYIDFPHKSELKAETIILDGVELRFPYRLDIQENIVIIMDLHPYNYFLHAFQLPDWKHICSFAERGDGPNNMSICDNIQFKSLKELWVLDSNRMEMIQWEMNLEKDTFIINERISIDKQLIQVLNFFVTENEIFTPNYKAEKRYHKLTKKGELIGSYGIIPTIEHQQIPYPIALSMAWRSFMDYHEPSGTLAFATQLGEVLEIYNLKTNFHSVWYGPHGEPKFKITEEGISNTEIVGFDRIQITDNFIYVVFEGMTFAERKKILQNEEKLIHGGNQIYVFDHEGNPIHKYSLDHRIYGMYVNEKENFILAADVNEDDPIVIYRLTKENSSFLNSSS